VTIAIIGAGLAGLVAANKLAGHHPVQLFDKSRGVSGRVATRRADPYSFDHGAQYITAESAAFRAFLGDMEARAVIAAWPGVFGDLNAYGFTAHAPEKTRYVALGKMNALGKALAAGLDIRLNCPVTHMTRLSGGGVALSGAGGQPLGTFDAVILAIPQPQLLDILKTAGIAADDTLSTVYLSGCFSLMLGGAHMPLPDFDGARVQGSPIGWIANNSGKPGRIAAPALVVQSTNAWADRHIDDDPAGVRAQLVSALDALLPGTSTAADHIDMHRWRYAKVETALGKAFWQADGAPVYAVGDWCLGAKVEEAFLSGEAVARHLLAGGEDTQL